MIRKSIFIVKAIIIKSALRRTLILVALVFIPVSSHAIPIEVTFWGAVLNSEDDFDLFGLGVDQDTLLGATVTAQYFFDTDDIPAVDMAPEPEIAHYTDGTDWIFAVTTIYTTTGDLIFSDSTVGETTASVDKIYLLNEAIDGTDPDWFFMSSYNISSVFRSGIPRMDIIQDISIKNPTVDTVDSFDAFTELQDQVGNLTCPGVCAVGRLTYLTDPSIGVNRSSVAYEIDSITIQAMPAVVPVPATVWLFGTALVGFVGMSRRRKVA